jgi:NADH-quinone oxidoreductase subunit M
MLWMYQRTMLGNAVQILQSTGSIIKDLDFIEILTLAPIVIMIFWIGIFPGFFLGIAGPAVMEILNFIK